MILQEPTTEGRGSGTTTGVRPEIGVGDAPGTFGVQLPGLERRGLLRALFGRGQDSAALPVPQPNPNAAAYDSMCERCSEPSWLQHRGPAYSVLAMHSDFIEPPFQQVHAIPNREFIASNYKSDHSTEELYYVNGMQCGPRDVERHLSSLVKTFGKPVTAIINDQECDVVEPKKPGFFRSLWHGLCGFLSAQAGYAVEPAAVGRVEHAIQEHVQSGKPLHLIAHSQGSIIVANALERMLGQDSPLSLDEKSKVLNLVRVSTFGAAEHYFPAGVRVQEYAHRGDATAYVTSKLADAREWIGGVVRTAAERVGSWYRSAAAVFGRSVAPAAPELRHERAPVVYLEGNHDFGPFLEKIPEFFIEKAGAGPPTDGARVARALAISVSEARLSDLMHGLIIREMIHRGDRAFARAVVESHPGGMIGEFAIPYIRELRVLAAR